MATEILLKEDYEEAVIELGSLEAALKVAYNNYIDALNDYLNEIRLYESKRNTLFNSCMNHEERNSFCYRVAPPPKNKAFKYILDKDSNGVTTSSYHLVDAYSSKELLERKA